VGGVEGWVGDFAGGLGGGGLSGVLGEQTRAESKQCPTPTPTPTPTQDRTALPPQPTPSKRRTYGAVGQAGVADAEVLLDALHGGGQVQGNAREGLRAYLADAGGDGAGRRGGAGLKLLWVV